MVVSLTCGLAPSSRSAPRGAQAGRAGDRRRRGPVSNDQIATPATPAVTEPPCGRLSTDPGVVRPAWQPCGLLARRSLTLASSRAGGTTPRSDRLDARGTEQSRIGPQFVGRFRSLTVIKGVMTAASFGAAKGGAYARYLESKTVIPERGDYYLSPEGEPAQAPGRWLASSETLARLGLDGRVVEGRDFIALMEGRHPRSGEWLRPEGAGGGRGGGIDLTFSAPKSVSAIWALGDPSQRADMEAAHAAAVSEAMAHLTETVPTVRRRYEGVTVEERAADLVAAEYRHTTARGVVEGDAPDPQLHSHVIVTSAIRDD